ncbi:MAG: hypothetical protein CMO74_10300 [Verrucomicrobiales bacterium]|nr:hypothetical protein [Verrucomicrobiales bacterium]|tara:strand:+ start:346 stop:798 length:453 start_codon:yes stop_codon:yes gene_type:complete
MPDLDSNAVHQFFSVHCFNAAWELIDKSERTPEENEEMIQRTMASLWHWNQREDCTPTNLSIGYWKAARVYALAGEADNALKYSRLSLEVTPADNPFCLGYAHEAMARAESLAGNDVPAKEHLEMAKRLAAKVEKTDDRKLLENDLMTIL